MSKQRASVPAASSVPGLLHIFFESETRSICSNCSCAGVRCGCAYSAHYTPHVTCHVSRVTGGHSPLLHRVPAGPSPRSDTAISFLPLHAAYCWLLLADPRTRRRFYCLFSRYYHLIVQPGVWSTSTSPAPTLLQIHAAAVTKPNESIICSNQILVITRGPHTTTARSQPGGGAQISQPGAVS